MVVAHLSGTVLTTDRHCVMARIASARTRGKGSSTKYNYKQNNRHQLDLTIYLRKAETENKIMTVHSKDLDSKSQEHWNIYDNKLERLELLIQCDKFARKKNTLRKQTPRH